MEGGEELAFLQAEPVDLVDRGGDAEVGVVGVVLEIARVVWDPSLVVRAVLCVEDDGAVVLRHGYLAVVVGEDLELDDLAVETPQALEGEFGSVEYLDLGGVDACSNDVALVLGDLDLVGGDLELEVLDEFDPPAVLLVVSQRFARLLRLAQELRVGLAGRHVVRLHAVDLCYFVHQQSIL